MNKQEPSTSEDFFYLAQEKSQQNKLDEARLFLQRAIALSKTERNDLGRAMNLSLLGEVEAKAKNYDVAFNLFEQAITIFNNLEKYRDAGITQHQWAKFLYFNSWITEAGEQFLCSAQTFKKINDQATLALVVKSFDTFVEEIGPSYSIQLSQETLMGFLELGSKGAGDVFMNILLKLKK